MSSLHAGRRSVLQSILNVLDGALYATAHQRLLADTFRDLHDLNQLYHHLQVAIDLVRDLLSNHQDIAQTDLFSRLDAIICCLEDCDTQALLAQFFIDARWTYSHS